MSRDNKLASRDSAPLLGAAGKALALGVLLCLGAALDARAAMQTITPNPTFQNKGTSQPVAITFNYSATIANSTGIGLRLHFDSSRLTFVSVTNIFGAPMGSGPLFALGPSSIENDSGNEDGDNSTNKVFLMAWVDTGSGFPGSTGPQALFTANFTTAGNFNASTNVRVTAIDSPTGFDFSATAATVAPLGVPSPTPTSTPTGPTPTPTVTPTPPVDTAVLDVDGNGLNKPLTDGVLIVRWMVGFTGDSLISNAVANPCGRCTSDQIVAYLSSVQSQLDIDLNGQTKPLTDGVLILRWLVGFTGSSLINNATATNPVCQRCGATEIELYLQGLSN